MRRQNLLLCIFLSLPLAFASCDGGQSNANGVAAVTPTPVSAATTQTAPSPARQAQPVTATVEEVTIDARGDGVANVRLNIADGFHTHANPATDKFYIATTLTAEMSNGIAPGTPVYPPGVQRKLGFSEQPLSLYEGTVNIKLPLHRATKDATQGRHTLRAKLRVQHCNDRECFPPQNIEVPIPVIIN